MRESEGGRERKGEKEGEEGEEERWREDGESSRMEGWMEMEGRADYWARQARLRRRAALWRLGARASLHRALQRSRQARFGNGDRIRIETEDGGERRKIDTVAGLGVERGGGRGVLDVAVEFEGLDPRHSWSIHATTTASSTSSAASGFLFVSSVALLLTGNRTGEEQRSSKTSCLASRLPEASSSDTKRHDRREPTAPTGHGSSTSPAASAALWPDHPGPQHRMCTLCEICSRFPDGFRIGERTTRRAALENREITVLAARRGC